MTQKDETPEISGPVNAKIINLWCAIAHLSGLSVNTVVAELGGEINGLILTVQSEGSPMIPPCAFVYNNHRVCGLGPDAWCHFINVTDFHNFNPTPPTLVQRQSLESKEKISRATLQPQLRAGESDQRVDQLDDSMPLLEISWLELQRPKVDWLLSCFRQFSRVHPPPPCGSSGNLIMMWARDYEALRKSAQRQSLEKERT